MDTRLKKRSRRHATCVETKDEVAVETCANLSQSKEIHLTYDVLRILFQLLSYRDLTNVMTVSRSWAEAARKEIQTRYEPSSFMIHISKCHTRARDISKCHTCLQNAKCLSDKLQNLRIDPYISFYFTCNEDLCDQMTSNLGNVFHQTHKNSEIIMLDSADIIMEDLQMRQKTDQNVVCSFLPKIPNTDIRIFKGGKPKDSYAALEEQLMKTLKRLSSPNEETSTCFILIGNSSDHKYLSCLLTNLSRYSSKISSLWGGLVKECYINERNVPELRPLFCLGILITGRIKTWSTILIDECDTKEKIEGHLRMWKEKVQLKKHSIAYMFACCARKWLLDKPDKPDEPSIFKSVFPTLRLVGCFGDGEFGKFTLPELKCRKKNDTKDCTCWSLLYTQYSTVFMILTYD